MLRTKKTIDSQNMKASTIVCRFFLFTIIFFVIVSMPLLFRKKNFDCANLKNYPIEPAIAYYVTDFACGISGLDDNTRVEVVVWPNGRIIWSSIVYINNTEVIKYYESTISKKQLSAVLAKIETICEDKLVKSEAIHEDNCDQYYLIAFDAPVNYIYINQANKRGIKMAICFEDSFFGSENPEILKFTTTWKDIKAIIQQMIPESGREINPVFTYPLPFSRKNQTIIDE